MPLMARSSVSTDIQAEGARGEAVNLAKGPPGAGDEGAFARIRDGVRAAGDSFRFLQVRCGRSFLIFLNSGSKVFHCRKFVLEWPQTYKEEPEC